jgi:hypothetical protein
MPLCCARLYEEGRSVSRRRPSELTGGCVMVHAYIGARRCGAGGDRGYRCGGSFPTGATGDHQASAAARRARRVLRFGGRWQPTERHPLRQRPWFRARADCDRRACRSCVRRSAWPGSRRRGRAHGDRAHDRGSSGGRHAAASTSAQRKQGAPRLERCPRRCFSAESLTTRSSPATRRTCRARRNRLAPPISVRVVAMLHITLSIAPT